MMKFFRKHNKKMLAVFMALLLVVWLGGSALSKLVQPEGNKRVIADSRFGELRELDRLQANNVTELLGSMRIEWDGWQTASGYVLRGPKPLSVYEWMLLTREAERMGVRVSPDDAAETLNRRGLTTDVVNTISARIRRAPEDLYAAMAQYLSVQKAMDIVQQSSRLSEARLRLAARDSFEKIKVDLVAFKADQLVDAEAPPDESELASLFEEYREEHRGQGMNFGYYQDARVRAQYIKVDLEKVKEGLRVGDTVLERRAREYWKEHKDDPAFRRPPEPETKPAVEPAEPETEPAAEGDSDTPDPTAEPDDADAEGSPVPGGAELDDEPAQASDEGASEPPSADAENTETEGQPGDTPPADAPEASPRTSPTLPNTAAPMPELVGPSTPPAPPQPTNYTSFAEARETAMELVREQYATDRAIKIADDLVRRACEPWFDAERGEDKYRELPAGQDKLEVYDDVVGHLPPEFKFEGAVTTGTTDWFTAKTAMEVPGPGSASLEIPGKASRRFSELAFLVKGLVDVPTTGDVDVSLYLAPYQTGPAALKDGEGNYYAYRIIDVRPGRPAENLDEVRGQVVEDWRLKKAYEQAKNQAELLVQQAEAAGLKSAWDADTQLQAELGGTAFHAATPFARQTTLRFSGQSIKISTSVTGLGTVDDAFIERCFALGPADQGKEPVAVIELPDKATVAVIEWKGIEPLREDVYAREREGILEQEQVQLIRQVIRQWLDPELIRSRNAFVLRTH